MRFRLRSLGWRLGRRIGPEALAATLAAIALLLVALLAWWLLNPAA